MRREIILNPIFLTNKELNLLQIKNGNFYITSDTRKQILDIDNQRIQINDVKEFENESDLKSINKGFYHILETDILYFYRGNNIWIILKDHILNEELEIKLSKLNASLDLL